ncbi:MAG: Helix-turn-helix domain [Pseudomonadota bacterium]|jgi:predicted DNA-binding transcriptional regulator AlpA
MTKTPTSPAEPSAYSIQGFCARYGISRTLFYALLRTGEGPATVKIGRRRLIARQAAEAWFRALEARHG